MILRPIVDNAGVHLGFMMKCPGCGEHHALYCFQTYHCQSPWQWNGNLEKPTFSPSFKVSWYTYVEGQKLDKICHFVITDGIIQFCGDSTHGLANQSTSMIHDEND